jgi:tetratricopeptide (TPR) repeat protein
MALHLAWAGDRPPRLWILPFDNPGADPSGAYLEEAIPALAEQSLTLEGLTAPHAKHEVGKLLGATVMISGSFVKHGPHLLVTMRASDIESGMVTATAETRGPAGQVGRLVSDLYRRLARDLGRGLPDLRVDQIDDVPLSNLHFMRGLGYYYSARYHQALAEFMQATREKPVADIARLWLANAYLAQEEYDHAYLELIRLQLVGSRNFRQGEIEAKMRACEKHLSADEAERIRAMAPLQPSAKE